MLYTTKVVSRDTPMNHPNGNQISDSIWSVPGFTGWWDTAEDVSLEHPHGYFLGSLDDGWALDSLKESFLAGKSPAEAIEEAIDGYDPTPDYLWDNSGGEPPVTLAEMHHSAWVQKQELNS